ncbi:EAL domain-containing protein [uncultured Ruminococcus sp.]|uniref:EAL domain-containing protein n=1 Tax=uncultured Ruminococcus sp. TaxID=165186 RepID=UPI0025F66973|nr:EAL domain-containing protein [uncultured Ruminococcus sp.]
MIYNDPIFIKIAESLLVEFLNVFYVNAKTNAYFVYATDTETRSVCLEKKGDDFFTDLKRDADQVIYEEDKHIFQQDIQKDNLLALVEKGNERRIEYRLMINGSPVFHALSLIRGESEADDYFILGVKNIDKEVRDRQKAEKNEQALEIYNQIAGSLAAHFDTLYYVDMETNDYFEYSSKDTYKSLNIPEKGEDFFTESCKNIKKYVHPDDLDRVLPLFKKQNMLKNLKNAVRFNAEYRLVMNGYVMHCRCMQIWASDMKHILVGITNINDEVRAQQALEESRKQSDTYSRIAKSLALRYDYMYYINNETGEFTRSAGEDIAADLAQNIIGKDFFSEMPAVVDKRVHADDRSMILALLDRDFINTTLENKKQYSADFRLIRNGKTQYSRLTVMRSEDNAYFIVGIENIEEEVKKEQERIEAINRANEMARRDALTGTKNMNAFRELEESIQRSIDSGAGHSPFAIVICDINDLKIINDKEGHKAGDEYIKSSCRIICGIFAHSPVFRIGGDEFVAVLAGKDYDKRIALVEMLRRKSSENYKQNSGPVLAVGIGVYDKLNDKNVSAVFKRADEQMCQDKLTLKAGKPAEMSKDDKDNSKQMPAERKRRLDSLFEMNCISAEGMYVYICDMKYDYSRWSKAAVDSFGLPSEYMYAAGDIWEKHIHEEDRDTYRSGLADIFAGNLSGHDMQYRARRINGEYNVCTCRGIVLKDENGEPDYFAGTIRDHGIQSNIDSLTGLRNQYGFFDEIQSALIKNQKMRITLIGIAKFSEINEIYGYHFGNIVLQKMSRYIFDQVSNSGSVFRLDGTKIAILNTTLSVKEISARYEHLRSYFREGMIIDGKKIMLELNSGLIDIDNFNIDPQTVMTCLTFAYNESKIRQHGDLVIFKNDLGSGNRQRVEKFHAIRASITQGFTGFYLLYQPVVDAKTEKLIGAEALLRWKGEEYGIVPPDLFIPLLEQDPLFPSLGEWILITAVRDAKKVLELDPNFIINVNLSYSQIEKANFVDMVMEILKKTGYPPAHLCLEVTERCRLLDINLLTNTVCSLRSRGVKVALDDFGTGFSSVGIVKALPFDTIKIDRSFVRKIESDPKERELIKTFVMMANTYGAGVCVEGIESSGMSDILREFDVHSFQGYYYAKPLEYEEFMKWRSEREG